MVERAVQAESALHTGQKQYFLFPPSVSKENVNSLGFVLIQKGEGFRNLQSPPERGKHALMRKRFLTDKCCLGQLYQAGSY